MTELIVLRFVTGLFLGSAIPSAVALTGEYSPKRLRATFVLIIYCGFSLGFVAAGALAAWMLPLYGWRSLLWVGAVAPLTLAIFLFLFLHESVDFLVRTKAKPHRIWYILRRVDPALPEAAPRSFTTEEKEVGSAVGSLFTSGRTLGTVVLWIIFFLNLAEFYALQSWLPTILTNLHYPLTSVALATTLTTVGGIVIAIVIGPAMDTTLSRYLAGPLVPTMFGRDARLQLLHEQDALVRMAAEVQRVARGRFEVVDLPGQRLVFAGEFTRADEDFEADRCTPLP